MAFAPVQRFNFQNGSTTGSSYSAAFSSVVGSGNCVIVWFEWGNATNTTLTGVTDDKSNTYNIKARASQTSDVVSAAVCVLGNITNGPKTITLNFSGSQIAIFGYIEEWSGIAALADPSVANACLGVTGASSLYTGTPITPTVNGCLIWAALHPSSSGDNFATTGSGYTLASPNDGNGDLSEYLTQATAASITPTFSTTASAGIRMLISELALQPPGAGAAAAVAGVLGTPKFATRGPHRLMSGQMVVLQAASVPPAVAAPVVTGGSTLPFMGVG